MSGDRSASPEGRARSISPLTSHRESMEFKDEDIDKLNQMSQVRAESPQAFKESPQSSPRPRNVSGEGQTSGILQFNSNIKVSLK